MEQPQLPENRRTLYAASARFDRKERKLFGLSRPPPSQNSFDFQSHRPYVHRSKRQRRNLALDLGSVKASFKKGPGLDLHSLS